MTPFEKWLLEVDGCLLSNTIKSVATSSAIARVHKELSDMCSMVEEIFVVRIIYW